MLKRKYTGGGGGGGGGDGGVFVCEEIYSSRRRIGRFGQLSILRILVTKKNNIRIHDLKPFLRSSMHPAPVYPLPHLHNGLI
jgi:hypothetical protein